MILTIVEAKKALENREISSRELVETCLERVELNPDVSAKIFRQIDPDHVRLHADYVDALRAKGYALPPLAGVPITLKDNIDQQGQTTTAGSRVLQSEKAASHDATLVSRLKAAGCLMMGRTNMTEFAYSGLGLNPHFGTPGNPVYGNEHIPGGSSSGAAAAIGEGMALAGIGTDTGGSCRIPAAFCGLVGFRPSSARIPSKGVFPLSPTLDVPGPIAKSVDDIALLDSALCGVAPVTCEATPLSGMRFGLVTNYVTDELDQPIANALDDAVRLMETLGATIEPINVPEFEELPDINALGGFAAAESYHLLRDQLVSDGEQFDPRVKVRIERGREQDAADYIELVQRRQDWRERVAVRLFSFHATIMPTVPMLPPLFEDLVDDAEYGRLNLLALRNPSIANMLDCSSVSLPIAMADGRPIGLMLNAATGQDRRLLAIAKTVHSSLSNAFI